MCSWGILSHCSAISVWRFFPRIIINLHCKKSTVFNCNRDFHTFFVFLLFDSKRLLLCILTRISACNGIVSWDEYFLWRLKIINSTFWRAIWKKLLILKTLPVTRFKTLQRRFWKWKCLQEAACDSVKSYLKPLVTS